MDEAVFETITLGNRVSVATYTIVLFTVVAAAFFWFFPRWQLLRTDLKLCDEAIERTLEAPSTYHRVNAPSDYHRHGHVYAFTYEANKPSGAPLRGKGLCNVNPDQTYAKWLEN